MKGQTIKQLMVAYETDRRTFEGVSANTIKSDQASLRLLLRVAGDIQPGNVNAGHMRKLAAHLDKQSPATYNARICCIRAFYKWCRVNKIVPANFDPTLPFRHRSVDERSSRKLRIPHEKFFALLDSVDHPRDRAFLAMGLWSLLRGSDISALRVKDVDLAQGYLAVWISKTKKFDYLPILGELDIELRRWLTYYSEECGNLRPDWYLIPRCDDAGCPRDPDTNLYLVRRGVHRPKLKPTQRLVNFERIVHRALTALDLPTEGEGGHTLRRSGARAYYDVLVMDPVHGRKALRRVKTMLHHSTIAMTERYLGLEEDRLDRDEAIKGQLLFTATGNVTTLPRAVER